MNSGCPPREQLVRLLAAEPDSEVEAVARHVDECMPCQECLEQLTTLGMDIGKSIPAAHDLPGFTDEYVQQLKQGQTTYRSLRNSFAFLNVPARHDRGEVRPPPVIPDYEILGELGSGGMGIVYQARQVGLNRLVALKMLRTEDDPGGLARFQSEAEAVARLQHPNIVQIHEIGTVEGRPFLCLEYVSGGTLAEHLADNPLTPHEAAALTATVARAVQYAHDQGVVHRDLKPSNVLVSFSRAPQARDGEDSARDFKAEARACGARLNLATPKISDFGLAKQLDREGNHTKSGEIMGTPEYMAPEQAMGRSRRIGPAADIYALGTILYQLIAGRLPFKGETSLETLLQVMHVEPLPPRRLQPKVPPDLETITLKCLEKEPARRYPTALELARDLERFLAGEPIAARPPSAFDQWKKFARNHKGLVGGVIATLLALVAGLIATGIFAASEAEQRIQADAHAKAAEANAKTAETNFRAAESARRAARWEAYQGRLTAASGLVQNYRMVEAAQQLEAAPAELRGWEWGYLHSRLDDSVARLPFPGEGNRTALALAGERWQALAFAPKQLPQLWDVRRQERLATAQVTDAVKCWPLPHRDGTHFLVETEDKGPLVLLDPQAAVRWRIPLPRRYPLSAVAVSHDATLLAVAVQHDAALHLIDVASGQLRQKLANFTVAGSPCLTFSPDGRWLASGEITDGRIYLWNLATGVRQSVLHYHHRPVRGLSFSVDQARLASCSDDGLVCQWNLHSAKVSNTYEAHNGPVLAVAYSPDGQGLASAGWDRTVRVWGGAGKDDVRVLAGHTGSVQHVRWNAAGTELASASEREVLVWGVTPEDTPGVLRAHSRPIYAVAYSPDGRWFASGGWDNRVQVWDAARSTLVTTFTTSERVFSLAFSPDGNTLAARTYRSDICVWDVPNRRLRASLPHHAPMNQTRMHSVAISPDSQLLAAPWKNEVRLWDLATLHEKPALRLPTDDVRLAVFSPDNKRLAAVGADHVAYVLAVDTGAILQTLRGHEQTVQVLAFHPDGRRLVSAGEDQRVRLWDSVSGQVLHVLTGHFMDVFTAAFHPGGTRLVTGGRDRVVRVWDVDTGNALVWLEGHQQIIFALAFSPDGHTLLSAAAATLHLWDDFPLDQRLRARQEKK
jgi:eukaryotic-like serine/threonine-protein kinase